MSAGGNSDDVQLLKRRASKPTQPTRILPSASKQTNKKQRFSHRLAQVSRQTAVVHPFLSRSTLAVLLWKSIKVYSNFIAGLFRLLAGIGGHHLQLRCVTLCRTLRKATSCIRVFYSAGPLDALVPGLKRLRPWISKCHN